MHFCCVTKEFLNQNIIFQVFNFIQELILDVKTSVQVFNTHRMIQGSVIDKY